MASTPIIAVGRRKTSTARVYLTPGSGKFIVNGKEPIQYFKSESSIKSAFSPLDVTSTAGNFDVKVNVNGGGTTGQIGAVKLAIARALVKTNEELKPELKKNDMMTRDPRMVERKKYGQPKARKRFQFSKR